MLKDTHICRAEAAPDVWQANDPDPLVGTDCNCCGRSPAEREQMMTSLPKFSKVKPEPELHVHRGQRSTPVLKSVQCDECGETDFQRRCRQCGALFRNPRNPAEPNCTNCNRLAMESGALIKESGRYIAVDDWEEVSPA